MDKKEIDHLKKIIIDEKIDFIRLQFCDIFGLLKSITIPSRHFTYDKSGIFNFDGSSIEGFARIEESDMVLRPDYSTFIILPWTENKRLVHFSSCSKTKTASIICDVLTPNGNPFEGDPRYRLKKAIKDANEKGYTMNVGAELEFFLFNTDVNGLPTTKTFDKNGYFDLSPADSGDECRKVISNTLDKMGFYVEASHHECATAQHEIDFRYSEALSAADNIMRFKDATKTIAAQHGLFASFMPKPIYGECGSGMHINISLHKDDKNLFYSDGDEYMLSDIAKQFIAGLMKHSKAITAISNPIVNSYKRLVNGYEAPTMIAWSKANRSPLIRIPTSSKTSTRIEFRSPDPSCNPYITFAACLAAGMDGITNKLTPPDPINTNLYENRDDSIELLPSTLHEALYELSIDSVVRNSIGEFIYNTIKRAKNEEWQEYNTQVTEWEIKKYLKSC